MHCIIFFKIHKVPAPMFASLWHHKALIHQLLIREIQSRYRGSLMGFLWAIVTPLLMLAMYTFVFQIVFKARWNVTTLVSGEETELPFALVLFLGLIIHGMIADTLTRSTGLILQNANFVKKVVFPLEILTWVSLFSSLFHFFISFALLLAFALLTVGRIPLEALYLPLILLPYFLMLAGISWFLAALGVFLRDIEHIMGTLTMLILFLSPVFFSVDRLPEQVQSLIWLNPIAVIVENARTVLLYGNAPDFQALGIYSLSAVLIFVSGYAFFQRLRPGFADVV
ncbi:MAG: ABC transporter permease [Pseudomonadales bacterium]|nr:ABC transporter permease [Pseudomonadales bacterium]